MSGWHQVRNFRYLAKEGVLYFWRPVISSPTLLEASSHAEIRR